MKVNDKNEALDLRADASTDHGDVFRKIYKDLHANGNIVFPRGQKVKEIENYSYVVPPFVRFQNFKSRKLNLDYIKSEVLWYLKGDRFDTSIAAKAKLWSQIMNEDGSINSNYGQYIFGKVNQFDNTIGTLVKDRDSRRASIVILNDEHLFSNTKDVPCTYALNFRIRDGALNMTVHMRSQDAIFGMANDCPAFSIIHEMLLNSLRESYPDLRYGTYTHFADSFHVYERHFEMLGKLVDDDPYEPIVCPTISGPDEVRFLRKLKFDDIPEKFKFAHWLSDIGE